MQLFTKFRNLQELFGSFIELLRHLGQRRVVIELAMAGELPYIRPILENADRLGALRLILVLRDERDAQVPEVVRFLQQHSCRFSLLRRKHILLLAKVCKIHGFITSEQFSDPLLSPAICVFHGQPSKGITFTREIVERYDHFFFFGPLHERAYDEFVAGLEQPLSSPPQCHQIGYPKSDAVILNSSELRSTSIARQLAPFQQKILYAPAFNEHCTLRTIGVELIKGIASLPGAGVVVKLAPDTIGRLDNFYATGGVNWRQRIEDLRLPNVFVATDLDAGPSIAAADMMVTDVSGVAYECLAVGKPVVYYDCPDFYESVVRTTATHLTVTNLLQRDTMNAGRTHGTVVKTLDELIAALSKPLPRPDVAEMQALLLYNPGQATKALLAALRQLFAQSD